MKELLDRVFRRWEPALSVVSPSGNSTSVNKDWCWHMAASDNQERRTVEAGRRRKPAAAPPGARQRAETPRRRQDSGGGGIGDSSGAGLSSQPPVRRDKGRMSTVGIILVIIIAGIFFAARYLGGPGLEDGGSLAPAPFEGSGTGQISDLDPAAPFVTNYPAITSQTPTKSGQTWLVMLYQDADDKILEKDIYLDLNEAEKAGTSDRVKVVAQVDRYDGAYSGDGDWTGTRRFLISQDDNLGQLHSQEVADLGELNMSSRQTLIDFASWAITSYPADKYVLILSDHGMGWPGGWTDPTPRGSVDSSTPMQARLSNMLYLNEMDDALGQIRAETGLDKFEMIGLDACLMGQVEVFTALEPHARYAVASQEVEPSLGWAYADFLKALVQNPDMDGAELSRLVVQGYVEDDQVILDSSARADFLGQGSPLGGLFGQPTDVSPQQLAREIGQGSTLSAVDLAKISTLNSSLNNLAFIFQNADQKTLAGGRSYAESFTSVFGSQVPPSYIDLGNFLQIIRQNTSSGEITRAVDEVLTAIQQAVIAEKHGPQKPGATGIAIYFPNSQLYQSSITGAQSYTGIASRFATKSLWDDFMAYHYSGREFAESDTRAVVPTSESVRAPAAGGITVSPVTASDTEVTLGESVTLSADISGENIGHIYLFAGFYDQTSNSVFVADQDYLESPEIRQVNGVYYPDWGEGDFTLKFNWEPVVFAVSDGTSWVPALFKPQDYGRTPEEAIYTVDGIYTFAASGEQLEARLYFINGLMRQVFGFTGESEASAPREITPSAGDRFTIREEWLGLDSNGQVSGTVFQDGSTLTFGGQMFTWETLDAAAGDYAVGFVVADLDGNQQQTLTLVTVR